MPRTVSSREKVTRTCPALQDSQSAGVCMWFKEFNVRYDPS